MAGFYRDGCCSFGPEYHSRYTIYGVPTTEALDHPNAIGNDLSTPVPEYWFPGLVPGDRRRGTAHSWLLAHNHKRNLEAVPLAALKEHALDVPTTFTSCEPPAGVDLAAGRRPDRWGVCTIWDEVYPVYKDAAERAVTADGDAVS